MQHASILVVDDDAMVLRVVERTMRVHFDVTTAASAAAALEILAGERRFAVIVSDLRMPGMGGVQLLQHAMGKFPDTVRVLLSGNANLLDAIAAVNDGHIFRLLTKPFELTALRAAIEAAVQQHRLLTAERVLLEETLQGSIKALTALLAVAQPAAFGRALRMRGHATELALQVGMDRKWEVEVAALLSQVGCVTLDADTLDRWYHNRELTTHEREQIDKLPHVAETLVSSIPRLESVGVILRRQYDPSTADALPLGAAILAIVRDFDVLLTEGEEPAHALATMEGRGIRYNADLLQHFRTLRGAAAPTAAIREMRLKDVEESMVFACDVHAPNGLLLIARGQHVTAALMERLRRQSSALTATLPVRMIVAIPHAA